MSDNPKSYEVILFDHYQMGNDGKQEYLSAFNLDGTNYKIPARMQSKWGAFTLSSKGTPILLTFETFTNEKKEVIKYVVDAQVCDFDAITKAGVQTTLKRLLLAKDDDRNRSLALSYAKDVWVAKIKETKPQINPNVMPDMIEPFDVQDTIDLATTFFYFIKGEKEVETPHIEAHEKPLTEEEANA